jgi:hypothetical protein
MYWRPPARLSAGWALVFGVADAIMSVPDRIDAYIDSQQRRLKDWLRSMNRLSGKKTDATAAHSLQSTGALVTAATAVAVMNTEYETRDAVGDAVDALAGVYAAYQDAMDTVYTGLSSEVDREPVCPGSQHAGSGYEVSAAVSRLAINRGLRSQDSQSIILKSPSTHNSDLGTVPR